MPGCGSYGRHVRSVQDPVEEEAAEKLGEEDKEWGDKGEMEQPEIDPTTTNLSVAGVEHIWLGSVVVP